MTYDADLKITGELSIAKLSLRRDDVLVVKCCFRISPEIVQRVKQHMDALLPAGVICLVIDPSFDLSVVTPTDPVAPAIFRAIGAP